METTAKEAKNTELFTNLSDDESATVGGGYHCYRSHYRPRFHYRPYSYYRPHYSSFRPQRNYGYGYGYSGVTQTVNVNVLYND